MTDYEGQPITDLKGYMTKDQVKQLIDAADPEHPTTGLPNGFQLFLRLLWITGARVSEVLGDKSWYKQRVYEPAKVADVDMQEGYITLNLLKRKQYPPKRHIITLDQKTLIMIQEHIDREGLKPEAPLFTFSRGSAFYYLRKLGKTVGIIKVGEHGLHNHHFRHSHCIAYVKHNNTMEGLRKLQRRIGHANINTTAFYLQYGTEDRKETEELFGEW